VTLTLKWVWRPECHSVSGAEVIGGKLKTRILEVAVPLHATEAQLDALRQAARYTKSRKFDLTNVHLLAIDDESLGIKLKSALELSLLDWSHEVNSFEQSTNRYNEWRKKIIEKYNYKNKRAFFFSMNTCLVTEKNDMLLFTPYRHEKLEAWGTEKKGGG
jgi:hypothetical protein